MSLFKSLDSHHFRSLLKHRSFAYQPFSFFSVFRNPLSISPQTEDHSSPSPRKPLDVLFKEAVELCPRARGNEPQTEEEYELKIRLEALERELKGLKERELKSLEAIYANMDADEKKPKNYNGRVSLYAVFTGRARPDKSDMEMRREDSTVNKELSPDMELFVTHLYKEGYFKDANFLPENSSSNLDFSCFEDSYGRGFIKFAIEKFAEDNQEIAKWVSGSDLKMIASFGCPSLSKRSVFSAKRLRNFFEIEESTVCSKCVLKASCNFANQNVWKGDEKNLKLTDVMNVIGLYALDAVPPQLVVPDEIKASISRLLKEIVTLSQTTS